VFDYLVAHGRMKEKEARAKFRQVRLESVFFIIIVLLKVSTIVVPVVRIEIQRQHWVNVCRNIVTKRLEKPLTFNF